MSARRATLLLLCCVVSACRLPGVDRERLPEALVAIHHRTPEEARRRAESWRLREAAQPAGVASRAGRGVPHVDELRDLLGRALGRPRDSEPSSPGALALLDPRSGALRRIAAVTPGAVPQAWSGDRSRLMYRAHDGSRLQLWEFALESGEVRPLTRGRHAHPEGCYAWQDRLVVTVLEHEQESFRSWVALTAPGGRGPYRVLSEGPTNHSPSCAPDGRSAVWVDEARSGRPELRSRRLAEGGALRQLSAGTDPTFSPDGRWLVFSARTGGHFRLWRMRPDGSARAPLGETELDALSPSVSPDGTFVVYVASEQPPHRQLWLREFGTGGQRMLPVHGEADSPVW